jgi:AsmA family/AsmA-like C-terminal region
VQTTLLGAAIVVILALVTALVGPSFVDWGNWRAEVNDWVSHETGLEVRAAGRINVQILPTPTLRMQQVEFGRRGDSNKTRAQELRAELALGPLLSGELRATELTLKGPEFKLTLDRSGRLDWPAPAIDFDPDTVSIEHLDIEDGRALLTAAGSGAQLSLSELSFVGQVRSLKGPVNGEGSFEFDGRRYPYRLTLGRAGEDGSVKARFNLVPADRQAGIDMDGTVLIDHGAPRFEGNVQSTLRAAEDRPDAIAGAWRLASHLRLDSTAAKLDQIEFQLGTGERSITVRGDGNLAFGAHPELAATLSSPQVDLDRILGNVPAGSGPPVAAIKSLAESLTGMPQLPFALKLKVYADSIMLGGGMLQRLTADLNAEEGGWTIERLGLRAPGLTQVALQGHLGAAPGGAKFAGSAQIDSTDPRALVGWLAQRSDVRLATAGPLHFGSKVALASDKMAFDGLRLELDRMRIEGQLDYAWRAGKEPAKLNATLRSPELDLDRAQSLIGAPLGGASLGDLAPEWPVEGTLAIDLGRITGSGVEAKDIALRVRTDSRGFDIERAEAGDIGGAKLAVRGRMDTQGVPSGNLKIDLNARSLDGMAALVGKFAPAAAERIRRSAPRTVPLDLHASLAVDRQAGGASASGLGKFTLNGGAGGLRIDLRGEAAGIGAEWTDLAKLGGTKVQLHGQVDASDGSALVEMFGLDRLVSVNQRSGWLTLDLNGPLDGDLTVSKAELSAGGLKITANGTVRPLDSHGPSAQLAVQASAETVEAFRYAPSRRLAQLPWTTLQAKLALADNVATLADLSGSAAGVAVSKGRLSIGLAGPPQITGEITVASIDLPAAIGTAAGFPHKSATADAAWSAEPFDTGLLGGIGGRIAVNAGEVGLTSRLAARTVRAILDVEPTGIAINNIEGAFAGGRVSGNMEFARSEDGMTAQGEVRFADADVAELLGGAARAPMSGKLTVDLTLRGSGRSPFTLISTLNGGGSITWKDGAIARLDPAVFDAMTRALDRDSQTDPARIPDAARLRSRIESALGAGQLAVPLAEASIAVEAGQLRLVEPMLHGKGAEVALSAGTVDLVQSVVNAQMIVSPSAVAGATRPEIVLGVSGPIDTPKRLLDASGFSRWLVQRRASALEQASRALPGGEAASDPVESESSSPAPAITAVPTREPRSNPATPAPTPQRQRPAASTGDESRAEPRVRRPPPEPAPLPPPLDLRPPAAHPPRG